MRLEDITDVLCLSCILFFIFVSPQTNCPAGWFGSRCNYKCRCVNNACDANGECTGSYNCMRGWFGPACQYADVAFGSPNDPVLVDGDDSTCVSPTGKNKTVLMFMESFIFTWLRVHVRENGSATLVDMFATMHLEYSEVDCPDMKNQLVDNMTLDKHCDLNEYINVLILEGESVDYLCSVYVSGGRNVAIKENAEQNTTYSEVVNGISVSFTADKAVDGNRDPSFSHLSCTSTDGGVKLQDYIPTWTLVLSKKRAVHRYVIHNRDLANFRLIGFTLQSFDAMNNSFFVYKDTASSAKLNYTISHKPRDVGMVVVTVNNTELILTICEVELYGDSICDAHHYGRDCELTCDCSYGDSCFVSTGGCPNPCHVGFHGPGCSSHCDAGKFGDRCNSNCSQHCEEIDATIESPCNHVTGACIKGCKIGYSEPTCENECGVGKFGKNCSSSCSPACERSSNPEISPCDHVTGACSMDCKEGLTGTFCERASSADIASYISAEVIIGLCLASALILCVCYACFSKRKTRPDEESPAGGDTLPPETKEGKEQ